MKHKLRKEVKALQEKFEKEWWSRHDGEVNALMEEIESSGLFPYSYFCGHSIKFKDKANIQSGVDLCRSWALSVASKVRGHTIPFFGWNETSDIRFHFHTRLFTDVEVHPKVLQNIWLKFGWGKFETFNPEEHGDKYIFKKHFFENGLYPFCGVNRAPCRVGKVQQCIHRHRVLEVKLSSEDELSYP